MVFGRGTLCPDTHSPLGQALIASCWLKGDLDERAVDAYALSVGGTLVYQRFGLRRTKDLYLFAKYPRTQSHHSSTQNPGKCRGMNTIIHKHLLIIDLYLRSLRGYHVSLTQVCLLHSHSLAKPCHVPNRKCQKSFNGKAVGQRLKNLVK